MLKILCVKIFLHYIDIAIFAFGYFILPHPVEVVRHLLDIAIVPLPDRWNTRY